jgi:chromosome segregation protein
MKLKQIQLQGFKSFVDRTVINFTDDITCVVGPNGCGKSNLVDAIRWVLGEQSVKHLRGASMEDVIFHGAEDMPAVGMAEANLIFDNSEGACPPQYASFSEIQVTRRLFRSGDSEYYINRSSCRLKDITDLFLGSGMGTKAYSIIEQGRIEEIITMKHEQRRILIEEAAGVSKYRVRRQEAMRKMDATRGNLTRIRDIVGELKRQMNSLNRQAKKAERYKKYRERLKVVEHELMAHRALGIMKERDSVGARLTELENRELEITAGLEAAESELEAGRAGLLELERELAAVQTRAMEAGRTAEKLDSEMAVRRQEQSSLEANLSRINKDREELLARGRALDAEFDGLEAEEGALIKESAGLEVDLQKAESDRETKEAEHRELAEATEVVEKHLLRLRADLEKLNEKIQWTGQRRAELESAGEKISERKDSLKARLEQQAWTNLSYNEKLYQTRKTLSELSGELASLEKKLARARSERAVAADQLQKITGAHAMADSRLASLREMKQNFDGYQRGVKAIMQRKKELEAQGKNGTHGLIADAVSIDPEYETALEAVLGEKLQTILVRDRRHGLQNVKYLCEAGEGRSSFAPVEGIRPAAVEAPEPLRALGAEPLVRKVRVEGEYAPVVAAIIGDALVVDDMERASELRERIGAENALVTRDGLFMDRLGVIAGGSADSFSGFLKKNREIDELAVMIKSLGDKKLKAEAELNNMDSSIKEISNAAGELREKLHRLDIEKNNLEKDLRQGTDAYNSIKDEAKYLDDELAAIEEDGRRLEEEAEEARAAAGKDDEARLAVEKDLESRRSLLSELRAEHEAKNQKCTAVKVRAAALGEKLASLKKHFERTARGKTEVAAAVEKCGRESEETSSRIEALCAQVEQLVAKHRESLVAVEELEGEVSEGRARFELESAGIREREAALKETNREREQVKNECRDTELLLSQLKVQWDGLCETAQDKFSRELEDIVSEHRGPVTADFPIDERRAEREELRQKLHRMGANINLFALEEYEQVSQRHSFLTNQEADLIAALEKLETTIAKINSSYKRAFKKTFEQVNEKFQEVFPRLFNGGKAFLQLTNPDDLLEAGVEIYAQPPGKRMNTIALLSGGEKALASSALIMSLFLVKPSPFCLLDEVDAALDDVNVVRFNDLLTEISKTSQLILITHNKRTMEMAAVLHGVTMEKQGISKIVSVRLKESGEINGSQPDP